MAAAAVIASFGTVAFAGSTGVRIGVLPIDATHLLVAIAAALAVVAAGWNGNRGLSVAVAISPLILVLLPWLPFPVPAAFLAWTGGLASLVWIAAFLGVIALVVRSSRFPPISPPRHAAIAGAAALVIFSIAAWLTSPSRPGGDEPHYLVITQSLLYDHDLRIENNHARGDYHAYFAGDLAPDSIRRGRDGEIYSIHAPGLPALVLPAFAIGGYHGVVFFLMLAASAACALAWWLAWRTSGSVTAAWFGWACVTLAAPFLLETFTVYPDGPGAAIVLTGVWALLRPDWERAAEHAEHADKRAAEHAEHADKRAAEHAEDADKRAAEHAEHAERADRATAWRPWFLHGLALATLPWMHTRFAVLAATLGGLVLVRLARAPNPLGKAIAFLAAPALSALGWLFFFAIIYGTPDPSAPYGSRVDNSFAYLPDGLGGVLFDQGFGLLATAPALVIAIAGFARTKRLALEWIVMAVPYLLSVTTFAMWWAGTSGPARFLVPLVLPLAIPAACAWAAAAPRSPRTPRPTSLRSPRTPRPTSLRSPRTPRPTSPRTPRPPRQSSPWPSGLRPVMTAALVVSMWLTAVMAGAGGGRLAYHTRNETGATDAPWADWASHLVDLPSALPAFVPLPVGTPVGARGVAARSGFAATLSWILGLSLGAWLIAVLAHRRNLSRDRTIAVTSLTFGCAAMAAMSVVWKLHAAEPVTIVPAQMDLLRRVAAGGVVTVDLIDHRRLTAAEALATPIQVPIRRFARGGGPRVLNRPLAAFPMLPAGSYLLSATRHGSGDGWIMAGVGNDQFAIVTQPIAAFDAGVRLDLPVGVRVLSVRADEGARDQLDSLVLRPLAQPSTRASSEFARRAVRYPDGVVFFLDDRAFPEPSGFWVGGAREASIVIAPDRPRRSQPLTLRNAPVENTVALESGTWRESLALAPGEVRTIAVPLDAASGTALLRIRCSSGFRPSERDPNSRDGRFLGVFVEKRGS